MHFVSSTSLVTALLTIPACIQAFQPRVVRNLRSLKAAKVDSGLESRDGRLFEPRSVIDLKYEDGEEIYGYTWRYSCLPSGLDPELNDPYHATLHMETKTPTIMLEHMSDVVSGVACTLSGIQLQFASSNYAKMARNSWNMPEFVMITSNEGCNKNGQRLPYM